MKTLKISAAALATGLSFIPAANALSKPELARLIAAASEGNLTRMLVEVTDRHTHQVISSNELDIRQPTIRATPPNAPVSGGYLFIRNTGNEPDRLIGGSASFAGKVEVHEMKMDGDIMRMRALDGGLLIPAGEEVVLERGGLHLMFMQLKERMEVGSTHRVTLEFERAGSMEVDFRVTPMGGGDDKHDAHSNHKHEGG